MKCPKCGNETKVHETQLHECPSGGTPMKCDACYHTWCEGQTESIRFYGSRMRGVAQGEEIFQDWLEKQKPKVKCPKCGHIFSVKEG